MGCSSSAIIIKKGPSSSNLRNQPFLKLNSNYEIPQFGYGVYEINGDILTKRMCIAALYCGIRHIDTAHAYENERGVGQAIEKLNIPREELFITSKLWVTDYGKEITLKAIDKILERLNLKYLDLLLLHQPVGDYITAYKEMEEAVKLGKVRSIGLSNFEENLDDILKVCSIKPAVIQVECHPFWSQDDLRKKVKEHNILIGSWYPLGHGDKGLLRHEIFTKLGNKYKKTNAQIILRWHIQKGNIVFPKSTNEIHIKENFKIFDFNLTEEEMDEINKLGKTKRFLNLTLEEKENFKNLKPKD